MSLRRAAASDRELCHGCNACSIRNFDENQSEWSSILLVLLTPCSAQCSRVPFYFLFCLFSSFFFSDYPLLFFFGIRRGSPLVLVYGVNISLTDAISIQRGKAQTIGVTSEMTCTQSRFKTPSPKWTK